VIFLYRSVVTCFSW